jgi:hypothetical protein
MVFTTEEDARVAADREAREIGQQIGIQGVIRPLLIGVAPDPRPVDHAPDPRPADDEDDNPTRCPTCGLPVDPGWSEGPGDSGPRPEGSG